MRESVAEIFQVDGFRRLEEALKDCQTKGLHIQLECSCKWLLLFAKNDTKNWPLGNLLGFSYKVATGSNLFASIRILLNAFSWIHGVAGLVNKFLRAQLQAVF